MGKTLKTMSAYTESNMFRSSKTYPSHDTVPLMGELKIGK
jgi:hypothetical protein